ncbi:TetR/AcrR family transcriptional regulator [Prescottella defluvii]|uniref:TetR/AcrR family transcriptional regulator n=1 Tax=Prescottella defluvii TaxID=1323361 RepID=UPI0012E03DDE|nr:TetR/AcrR family transcriptional regulator [Prescottella defluvii]
MGQHSDRVRHSLMDAAEELFATHGIDAVSNRRIAEHAGNANHSAVSYHFGGHDELVHALLLRQSERMRARRAELVGELGDDPGLADLLASLIVPFTDYLASAPVPSWRARFLQQLRTVPSAAATVAESITADPLIDDLVQQIRGILATIPEPVLRGRSWMIGRMTIDASAQYEAHIQDGATPNWTEFAYFLIDSYAGMLAAPVTHPGDFLGQSKLSDLL